MKKTYNNPTLKVVKIQPAQFIAASEQVTMRGEYNSESVTMAGRRGSFSNWEEEEE